ncbi:MAG TPA: SusC/RagA family TonB-linked outer membrane protein [Saprospiraceae bacterium]|nr:SusC/RagA family TonB-linked outer membrane protein [Saprospiraceae bacterium]HNT18983.1 SusC/RagA family TonB-linked outer membrane protein [Saprospiraceae bacterium]
MIKKTLLILLVFCGWQAIAQRTITGKVTNGEDSEPLVGVTILILGTTQGTVTDFDGNYSLDNVPDNASLRFTYTGFQEQVIVVGNQSSINVTMQPGVALSEVVVTALGVSREKKALGYSVSEVGGDNFIQARENNIANALTGRVAGVNVSKVASGPGGSSRVIIRGNKSLNGSNQPLYVVDGVPMDNSGFGQAGLWGGSDEGDGMSSINPDDIESITVLKGANAAALYGARAANGVINIITKRGAKRKGIGVEFNSNFVFETLNDLSDLQNDYGSGGFTGALPNGVSTKPSTIQEAGNWGHQGWGPKFDGSSVIQFDGISRPYSYAGDRFKEYFETGTSFTNSLAFTGGTDNSSFRISATDLRGSTILPNTGFDRTNVSLAANSKFGKRITMDAKILYSLENNKNRPTLSDSPGNGIQNVWKVAPNIPYSVLRGDPNKIGAIPAEGIPANVLSYWGRIPGEELQVNPVNDQWSSGGYWAAYQFINNDKRDRVISSGRLRYDITDFLYVEGQIGLDKYARRAKGLTPQGTGYNRAGAISEGIDRVQETNFQYTVGFNKTFGDISVNVFGGGNRMRRESDVINISSDGGFNVPFQPFINNSVRRNWGFGQSETGINSLLGQAELGYKGYLYLTGTVRNDWFSVLNPEFNSILYPSVQASFVASDAFKNLPSFISYLKLRGGWAQVGNATVGAYSTAITYGLNGAPHVGTPLGGFAFAIGQGGTIPNPNLKPLTSTEIEFGVDIRLFQNRVYADLTYYSQKTTDDILPATISRAAGFDATAVNLGKLTNRGFEALIGVTPIQGKVTWDVSLNMAKNNNEVVSLIEGSKELVLEEPRTRNVFIKHIVGYPYGMITGRVQKTDPSGNLVFDQWGSPIGDPNYQIIGNGVADLTGGLNNSLTWNNFNLGALVDFKFGGDLFSGTNMRLTQWGYHKQSLIGRQGEAPLHVKGVIERSPNVFEPIDRDLTPQEAQRYWSTTGSEQNGKADMYVYDASFIKLRQLTLGYNFPNKMLSKTPFQNLSLSFVGRNLAILHKNVDNIDPESSYTVSNSQGMDYFGFPSTRSYGFNLKVGF